MNLQELIVNTPCRLLAGQKDMEVTGLSSDSRKVTEGGAFVCISGTVSDGHKYLPDVIAKGAKVLFVEKSIAELQKEGFLPGSGDDAEELAGLTILQITSGRTALAALSAAWFRHPADELTTIGVTGTKGKTTTTYMIREMLETAGKKCGLIGTVEVIIGEKHIPAVNTTPESYLVQQYFREMVDAGITHVVMEVSSQALMLSRVDGFTFDYGVFTNIEPDHIGPNEHTDFNQYLACKKRLFSQCRKGFFNADADHLAEMTDGVTCEVAYFGQKKEENDVEKLILDYAASDPELFADGGSLGVRYQLSGKLTGPVTVHMPGGFSVHNSLAAICVAHSCGVTLEEINRALETVRVNGRVELMPVSDHFSVIIDYAHNAMGLESLLTTLKAYHPKRLVCLFGCGGNRDRARRFEMGEVSSKYADLTVVTSDNPRFEEPEAIIEDIIVGVKKADGAYVVIPDRKEAIEKTIASAEEGDVIVIAGKGHEDYQEIKGVKHHMDDHEMVMACKK